MRAGGRGEDELRPVRIEPGYMPYAEGSALICCGNTRVICTATVEERVPAFLLESEMGWITAEYSLLPRSSPTRVPRPEYGRVKGRTREIQRFIGRSLRAGVRLGLLAGFTITIDCDVLQADGGTRTAAVTGSWVALRQAFRTLFGAHPPDGLLRSPFVAAVSVGVVGDQLLLDLDYEEDHEATTDMNVVMTEDGRLIEVQATAEGRPFTRDEMQRMIDLAEIGITQLVEVQRKAVAEAERRFESVGGSGACGC